MTKSKSGDKYFSWSWHCWTTCSVIFTCGHACGQKGDSSFLSLQALHLPAYDLWWILSGVAYDGKKYSGSYGGLGAMSILLHSEEKSSDVDTKYICTLREPMVKVIHFVSAVE